MHIKRNPQCKTLRQIVEFNTGMPVEELLNVNPNPYIYGLSDAVRMAKEHIGPIYIVGDYDADGITASAILRRAFNLYGKEVKVRLPLRFTEGYGLSTSIIEEAHEYCKINIESLEDTGLIITVDNGIAAHEAIVLAKKKGLKVIILDHHLPVTDEYEQPVYPAADIIVDPAAEAKSEFHHYCGAGLAYRFAQELLPNNNLTNLLIIAAIGTIADVVPLIGANRYLVKEGLHLLNKGYGPAGIKEIVHQLKLEHIAEDDIGYRIGPILNAPSRLLDGGAMESLSILIDDDEKTLWERVGRIIRLNDIRKGDTDKATTQCTKILHAEPIVIYNETIEDAEKESQKMRYEHNRPVIIFNNKKGNFLYGYGDLTDGVDINTLATHISHTGASVIQGQTDSAFQITVHKDCYANLVTYLEKYALRDIKRPIVVLNREVGDGIIGLVAGKFCEKYQCPVIVFTQDKDGTLKGSGRSIKGIHLKRVLDQVNQNGLIVKYGGHAGAAGLTIEEKCLNAFIESFTKQCGDVPEMTTDLYYDIDISDTNVDQVVQEIKTYAPFGEGNPSPTFCLYANTSDYEYRTMGNNSNHFKLTAHNLDIIGFNLTKEYQKKKNKAETEHIVCVGSLAESWFNGRARNQFRIKDLEFSSEMISEI